MLVIVTPVAPAAPLCSPASDACAVGVLLCCPLIPALPLAGHGVTERPPHPHPATSPTPHAGHQPAQHQGGTPTLRPLRTHTPPPLPTPPQVINLRSIKPLDRPTILDSVRRTHRLVGGDGSTGLHAGGA